MQCSLLLQASKYMDEFDSTHCTQLPASMFRSPWTAPCPEDEVVLSLIPSKNSCDCSCWTLHQTRQPFWHKSSFLPDVPHHGRSWKCLAISRTNAGRKLHRIYAQNLNAVPHCECNWSRFRNFCAISRENCVPGYNFHHGALCTPLKIVKVGWSVAHSVDRIRVVVYVVNVCCCVNDADWAW